MEYSRKYPGRQLAWISGYPSWKFPGGMPGGKVPFSRFHRVFLDPSWKVPGNILDPSRKFPGWRRPFLQNKVVLWFFGDLKTGSFLEVCWKDAVFRTLPGSFLEVCCSTGRMSSRIRSDFRGFGISHIPGNFQEGCRWPASFLVGGPNCLTRKLPGRPSWKDAVRLETSRPKWHV